jgi:hypothetical protein
VLTVTTNQQQSNANSVTSQSCPVCGQTSRQYLFKIEDSQLERCTNCGLIFQQSKEQARTYPTTSHMQAQTATEDEALAAYIRLLKQQVEGKSLLLVAQNGHMFSDVAAQQGYNVEKYVKIEDLSSISLPVAHYDAAVVLYNLERSPNPVEALQQIRASLKPNGTILIVTQALDSWSARFFQRSWTGWEPKNNFYFSTQTIQSVLLRSGFYGLRIRQDYRSYSLNHVYARAVHLPRQTLLTRTITVLHKFTPRRLRQTRLTKVPTSLMVITAKATEQRVRPLLSVIMPVFNEEATVGETLEAVLNKHIPGIDKEVVVVESNSKDRSREIVQSYQDHPEIKIVLEDRPRGKGFAVRTGLAQATGDFILIQDADQEYDINDYDVLIEPLRKYQNAFVLGSRHSKSNGWKMREFNREPGLAAYFNFGHLIFCSALNLLYGQQMKDPFTMYKVFRRDCLSGLQFETNRFDFDFELVIKLLRKGYVPLEIPVNYHARSLAEGKKVTFFRDPITWIRALVKFRFSSLYPSDQE